MLGGKGYYRGSSVLISGSAGTGKTSFAAHYADAACRRGERKYVLRLYVTGTTPRSVSAIRNIMKICDEHLKGAYDLEVIDI